MVFSCSPAGNGSFLFSCSSIKPQNYRIAGGAVSACLGPSPAFAGSLLLPCSADVPGCGAAGHPSLAHGA